MQLLSAKIAQAGNEGMVIVRKDLTPADIHILRKMHGYKSVRDVKVIGEIKRTSAEERQRLMLTYKPDYVAAVFPSVAYPLPQVFEDEGDPDDALFAEEGDSTERVTAANFSTDLVETEIQAPAPVMGHVSAPPSLTTAAPLEAPMRRRGNPEALAKARAAQAERRAAIAAAKQGE